MPDGPTTQTTAAIYCRISNDPEGRELGVQRQEQDCRDLADRHGLQVVQVYVDNDVSASTKSRKARPQYAAMLRAVEAGDFKVVLAYSNSRLTRRPKEWLDLMEVPGLRVHTVVSGSADFSTADGRAVALTIAAWDAAEAERTSERVARAAKQRAMDGEWHGGRIPHGYMTVDAEVIGKNGKKKIGKRLVVNPETAPLVQEAARRLLSGESLYAIANDFNARGLPTSQGTWWRSSTIRRAMLSPSIVGKREHDGELYDGQWEPLIAEKAWMQLRELLNDTSRKFGPMNGSYAGKRPLGGGLTVCAGCGKMLVSARFRDAIRLVCHKQATGGCGKVTIKYDPLERFVLEQVMAAIDSPVWRAENARQEASTDTATDRLRIERKTLQEERARVVRSYDLGVRSESEMLDRVRVIDAEVASIDRRLHDLAAEATVQGVTNVDDAWALWDAADTVKRRRFLASLVESVHVHTWPEGMPTKLTRRTSEAQARKNGWLVETEDEFAKRAQMHLDEAMRQRVCIKWRR